MKKDIYIIKNKINYKVYIGQTVNPTQRWSQYKSAVLKTPNSQLITKAMKKYGFDAFYMEILEKNCENYDEREKFWIQQYNSITPNGYNVAPGGAGTGSGIFSTSGKIKSESILNNIVEDLIIDVESIQAIADKYGVSRLIIQEINFGRTYFNPDLNYPLRESKKYSQEKIKQITYALKYELDKSLKDIAKEFQCDESFLNDINQGKAYFREYLNYPLRTGKMKKAELIFPQIVTDLLTTELKQSEIAKKYNVSQQCVSDINCGRKFRDDTKTYPLRARQYDGKTCFTPNELAPIYEDIKNSSISFSKLAEKYGVSAQMLRNLNVGKIKKYFDPALNYPLRPLKKITPCIDYSRIVKYTNY